MTAFEDFVNLELPRRGVTFIPSMVGGYDGDPNDAGAPDTLKYSPVGTIYYETSNFRFWIKMSASSGDWEITGLSNFTTSHDIDLYVDNINGNDDNDGSSSSPLKTLVEAESRLPLVIDHRVIIHVLPYDVSVPNVGSYEWPIFRERIMREHIVVINNDFYIYTSGTAQSGTDREKIVTTGGLTEDEYVTNKMSVRITSGVANGDIRTISENTTSDIEVGCPFTDGILPGDTYEIIHPVVRYSFQTNDMFADIAIGSKQGVVAGGKKISPSLWIVNAILYTEKGFLQAENQQIIGLGIVLESGTTEFHIYTNGGWLSGMEFRDRINGVDLPTVPTMSILFPSLSPQETSLVGWGITCNTFLYLAPTNIAFEGFLVNKSWTSCDPAWTTGSDTKIGCYVYFHGGRSGTVFFNDPKGRLRFSPSFIHPHKYFLVKDNTSYGALYINAGNIHIDRVKVIQSGSGPGISASGYRTNVWMYSIDFTTLGIGVVAKNNAKIIVSKSNSGVVSGTVGDFSEDGGSTLRSWSSLISGAWFWDLNVDSVTHIVSGSGSVIGREQ